MKNNNQDFYFKWIIRKTPVYKDYLELYREYKFQKISPNSFKNARITDSMIKVKYEKFLSYIMEVQMLGVDMSNIRRKIESISLEKKNYLIYFELENTLNSLIFKYGKYINEKNILLYILDSCEELTNENHLKTFVDYFLMRLEILKDNDIYTLEEFLSFIELFYKVGYNLMILEFSFGIDSKIFKYFTSSEIDRQIINDLISTDIEELKESVNYINGIDLLVKKVDSNIDYLNEDVILSFVYCKNSSRIRNIVKNNLIMFKDRIYRYYYYFMKIYYDVRGFRMSYFDYKIAKRKYMKDFKRLLRDYDNYISRFQFVFNEELNDIKGDINTFCLRVKHNFYD